MNNVKHRTEVIIMAKPRKLTDEMVRKIRAMYETREFTMNDLAREFGVSTSVISNAINKGYCLRPRGITETKERTKLIESHIMEFFDTEKELIETIKANLYGNRTVSQACYEVVQGGCLLVYYNTVNDFLKELNCQLGNNDETNWSMYKKLVVNRMQKMYERYIK